jgi:hypothetical protein
VEAEAGDLAEALYRQEVRLQQSFDPDSEHVAALLYQLATLQYCRGRHAAAAATLRRCLGLVRSEFEGAEEHLLTVRHRLGMALGAAGEYEPAREALHGVAAELVEKLGPGNPVTCELDFMVALMALRQGEEGAARAGGAAAVDPGTRAALLGEMEGAVGRLAAYGEEHMLVRAAREQLEAARAGAGRAGGGGAA